MKSVDITILSWDRVDDTELAIESALQQTGIDGQVIVVDQGSTNTNAHEIREFCRNKSRLSVVFNTKNLGVPGGRNQAAIQNNGDYIVALDNDAEFIDEHQIRKAVEIMENDPEIGVLAFRILRFGTNEDDKSSWCYWQNVKEFADQTFYTTRFVGAGHMIRRAAFEAVGGYDDHLFFLHEEVDLAERIVNKGYKIRYTPEVVIGHKVSAENRVHWTGPRWRLDIRNSLYLHIKLRTPFLTLCFHTLLMLRRGFRARMFGNTLRGLWQGLAMMPLAIRYWHQDVGIEKDQRALAYRDACSQTQGMTTWQRIRLRLRGGKVAPGKHLEG